ncbi:BTB/POZ and MATH domain-containing protein 1-like [Aegilops tauschii subsp. strangulata]|uniref:Speckle-type POZ protein-like protein n=1 Tax=Aegilops tauschii TaxID=37682 RepID=M8CRK9_AEGTA|nr:BTB/POZ and MATH domain-containing protein 1-like [Aegilops tauschii subsp. strangulata]
MATCKSSSTVVVHTGEHLFEVVGHSLVSGQTQLTSTFRVGGANWCIRYYPNGERGVADSTSVYLRLLSPDEVMASGFFCLQDPASPSTGEKNKRSVGPRKFLSSEIGGWGYARFGSKADLAPSGCLKDDCLVIKCAVEVSEFIDNDARRNEGQIIVPPSNLGTDLGYLLESGLKADLTVKISSSTSFKGSRKKTKSFKVHACVLGARSPVFRAQLGGSMKESKQSSICIKDMDDKVFEALIHYMYMDCLPDFMEETTKEATNMAQHLLVVADRYAVERLKLMCASKLSNAIDADSVCFTLDLAQQYNCQQLKDCCLKYMAKDRHRLRDIKKTKGFEQLQKNHLLIVCDILDEVIGKM